MTKGHHYAPHGGGMGWTLPGPESVAVHWIKTDNETIWNTIHEKSSTLHTTFFPPILHRFNPRSNEGKHRFTHLNQRLQTWYSRKCHYSTPKPLMNGGKPFTWPGFGCHQVRGFNLSALNYSYAI